MKLSFLKNKKIKKAIRIFLGIIFANLFVYYFITSEINPFLNWKEIKLIKTKIEETPPLPDNVYEIISEVHQMKNLNSHLIHRFFNYNSDSPALMISSMTYIPPRFRIHFIPLVTIHRIQEAMFYERYFSNKQLLSYYISQFDFNRGQIGIENAAQFFFNKPLEELSTQEVEDIAHEIF